MVSAKIKAAIEGLALERPPLPIRSICRQVRQFAQLSWPELSLWRSGLGGVTLQSNPGVTIVCYQSVSGFSCIFIALKSRNLARKPRT